MPRKQETVRIDTPGRDEGKVFMLTEMGAAQAESWASRAFFALANSGASIPEQWMGAGMAAVATIGITGLQGLPYALAEPLLAELMACCQFQPDPQRPGVLLPDLDKHIEEVRTRLYLKARAFVLHTGFTWADVLSRLEEQRASATRNQTDSPSTPTPPAA